MGAAYGMHCILVLPAGTPAVMDNDPVKVRKDTCGIHANVSTFTVNTQKGKVHVGGIVYPPCFTIDARPGLITVYESQTCHCAAHLLICWCQGIRTAGYHVFDGSG